MKSINTLTHSKKLLITTNSNSCFICWISTCKNWKFWGLEQRFNQMDEAVRKVAALGFPGVVLLIAMATTGLTGAAAITAALAMLGPGGMIGGIIFLGVIGIAADALSKFGLEAVLVGVYRNRLENGETLQTLCREISGLFVSDDLKRKLREELGC
jgi:hypothetical protein